MDSFRGEQHKVGKKPLADFSAEVGPSERTAVWRFDDVELDERTRELRIDGEVVSIEPRPLALLMLLLRRPNEVITHQEIVDLLWAGRAVSDSVITKCVARLRGVLGASRRKRILTAHGFGYRFVGDVRLEAGEPVVVSLSSSPQAGAAIPTRANWTLERPLGGSDTTWSGIQPKTGERRVFKFADTPQALGALKRELAIYRLLRKSLPAAEGFVTILDWNYDQPPYFNEYEYCAGGSLLEWADQGLQSLDLGQRLELVACIADVLASAHALGVMHKDLKPANVLLAEAEGRPASVRLADFGSGQVLDPERLRSLQITQVASGEPRASQGSGTPIYLAPEVLAGEPPTLSSDLYSLGLMLYQIVVGDLRRPLAPGWERDIASEVLREDIAEACDLKPARRLGDAAVLARRLRALPAREAQRARQRAEQQANERTRQALARTQLRRRWLALAALIFLLGAMLSSVLYLQARAAREQAQLASEHARQLNVFLSDDLLGSADPFRPGGGRRVTVAEILDTAAARLPEGLAAQPVVRAGSALTLARAYQNLMLWGEARALLESELPTAEASLGPLSPAAVDLRLRLAGLATEQDDYSRAAVLYADMLRPAALAQQPQRSETLRARSGYGWLIYKRGDFAACVAHYERLFADLERWDIDDPQLLADSRWNLAEALIELNRFDRAASLLDESEAYYRKRGNTGVVDWVRTTRAYLLLRSGRLEAAEALLAELRRDAVRQLGAAHNVSLFAEHFLGVLRLQQGRNLEAAGLFEHSLELRRQALGESHHYVSYSSVRLVQAWLRLGRVAQAVPLIEATQAQLTQVLGPQHVHTLRATLTLAEARVAQAHRDQAIDLLEAAMNTAKDAATADTPILGRLHARLADLLREQDPATAALHRDAARASFSALYGFDVESAPEGALYDREFAAAVTAAL